MEKMSRNPSKLESFMFHVRGLASILALGAFVWIAILVDKA